jgi:hypothetical protein
LVLGFDLVAQIIQETFAGKQKAVALNLAAFERGYAVGKQN